MSRTVRNSPKRPVPAPTATYKVTFGSRNGKASGNRKVCPSGKVPRVTRLLALAHRIDAMIRSAELRDWADAARVIGLTRARMTQIANLLLLAPEIQETILDLPSTLSGEDTVTEHALREIAALTNLQSQHRTWEALHVGPHATS